MARKLRKAPGMRERSPNVWEIIVQAGKDPVTGKYRQVTRRAYGGITEAKRVRSVLLAEVDQGQHSGTDSTVDQLYREWIVELDRLDRSPRTIKEYKRIYVRDIQPALGCRPISKVTTKLLTDMYAELQLGGTSVYMVRKIHAVVSSMMSQSCRWGWRNNNPAEWAQLPPLPEPEPVSPTPSEVQQLIRDSSDSKRPVYASLIFLAATTGARRGELCALRLSSIDWEQQTLRIARSIVLVDGKLVNRPTKNRRRRTISLDDRALELLREHIEEMKDLANKEGLGLADHSYLYSESPDGSKPWNPDMITQFFERLSTRTGLEHLSFKTLRSFMDTYGQELGFSRAQVSLRAGHDPAVAAKHYTSKVTKTDQQIASSLSTLISRT